MSATAAPQIVVFPRDQLSPKDKERLTRHGILAVEADDPSAVRVLMPSASQVGADTLLLAALDGLCVKYAAVESHTEFVRSLHRRIGPECKS